MLRPGLGEWMDTENQGIGCSIVRGWLDRYRETLRQIEDDEERLVRMTNRMEQVSSPQLNDMPRNPSPDRDKLSEAIARKDQIAMRVMNQHEFLKATRALVERLLTCCNNREAASIRLYYLAGLEWPEIVPYMFTAEEQEDNSRCLQNLYRYRRGGVNKITEFLESSDGTDYPTLVDVAVNDLKKFL